MNPNRIAFQGELGANSHEACQAAFPDMEPAPCATFEEAFEAVRSGDCRLGMIQVENSIAGRVADVHHLLPSSGLRIIGEHFKPIHFQLMANPGVRLEDLKTVASMPIAFAQCREVIANLGLSRDPVSDTALAGGWVDELVAADLVMERACEAAKEFATTLNAPAHYGCKMRARQEALDAMRHGIDNIHTEFGMA
jgi:prephenate dehydratase